MVYFQVLLLAVSFFWRGRRLLYFRKSCDGPRLFRGTKWRSIQVKRFPSRKLGKLTGGCCKEFLFSPLLFGNLYKLAPIFSTGLVQPIEVLFLGTFDGKLCQRLRWMLTFLGLSKRLTQWMDTPSSYFQTQGTRNSTLKSRWDFKFQVFFWFSPRFFLGKWSNLKHVWNKWVAQPPRNCM